MEKSHKVALLAALFCAFLLTSCGDGKYEVKGDGVYYTYWAFSFGNQEEELKGADAATFESVKDWLGRDHQHVWYKESLVEGAEPASVKVDDYPLFHDKRDYYFEGKPVHVADMASMRVIEISREEFWGADSRYIYFNNSRIEGGDPATLEVVTSYIAKDSRHVYYCDSIMADADPATFESCGKFSAYCKDKNYVWFCSEKVEGADVETFKTKFFPKTDGPDAEDKNHKYSWGKIYEESENEE